MLERGYVAHIGLQRDRFDTACCEDIAGMVERRRLDVGEGEAATLRRERFGEGEADARGGSRHDDGLARCVHSAPRCSSSCRVDTTQADENTASERSLVGVSGGMAAASSVRTGGGGGRARRPE